MYVHGTAPNRLQRHHRSRNVPAIVRCDIVSCLDLHRRSRDSRDPPPFSQLVSSQPQQPCKLIRCRAVSANRPTPPCCLDLAKRRRDGSRISALPGSRLWCPIASGSRFSKQRSPLLALRQEAPLRNLPYVSILPTQHFHQCRQPDPDFAPEQSPFYEA